MYLRVAKIAGVRGDLLLGEVIQVEALKNSPPTKPNTHPNIYMQTLVSTDITEENI